jgi:hypothetical protein
MRKGRSVVAVICSTTLLATLVSTTLVSLAEAAPSATVTRPAVVVPSNWSIVSAADPGLTSGGNAYDGDSCVGPSFCMAVGTTSPTAGENQIVSEWNGSSWSAMTNLPTSAPNGVELASVSCVSATFCVAVGDHEPGAVDWNDTYIEQWNGSKWSTVPSPSFDPTDYQNYLNGVSCVSTTFCVAAGSSYTASGQAPVLLQWNGSVWSLDANPAGLPSYTYITGVSCVGTFCEAVGGTDVPASIALQLHGTTWTNQTVPSGVGGGEFSAVSCVTALLCMATGGQNSGAGFVEEWDGSSWSIQSTPDATTAYGNYMSSIDCFGPTSCVAAGSVTTSANGDDYVNAAIAWNGSSWSNQSVPTQSGASAAQIAGLACVANDLCLGVGSADSSTAAVNATIWRTGYDEVASDGGLFAFGDAGFYGSMGGQHLNEPIVGMAMTPDGGGYWEVASDGGLFAFGDAGFYGSMGGQPLNQPIVGMTPTLDGQGYYEVASDGGLFAFGDAVFQGSMGGQPLNKPIVGMALTPDGGGYYEVASDGGIFAFGDAVFAGSMGGKPLNAPIVGIAITNQGGYYEVASDGGLFSFGVARFHGSMGGQPLNQPIVGMAALPLGGYYEVASDGGIFSFGGAIFHGSMGGKPLNEPIVGIGA